MKKSEKKTKSPTPPVPHPRKSVEFAWESPPLPELVVPVEAGLAKGGTVPVCKSKISKKTLEKIVEAVKRL